MRKYTVLSSLRDLKDIIEKISTLIQLGVVVIVAIIQINVSTNSSNFIQGIVSIIILGGLAFFIVYLHKQRTMDDISRFRFEILIEWIEEFKADKVNQPLLIHELDLRLKELKLSLAFCNTLKQRQDTKKIK